MSPALKHCPRCGRPVPPDAPAELCPSCLVRGGFNPDEPCGKTEFHSGSTLHLVIPEDASLPEGAPKLLGSYEVLEKIAHGGMGVVYKARHTGLDRVVALKMIRSGVLASRHDVERFHREARSAGKLRHPNIVTIHDIGEQDGQHYYTMDFVPGENLAERARTQPFSPREAAEIAAGVAAAIHYAHEHGVLHRDIKPANVLLTPDQQPRVLDFGLALVLTDDSTLTVSGTPLGSPPYMPPEQAAGRTRHTDARSDVYSLGALLYELLTGRPPFQAATTVETLKLVVETEAVSPRRLNPTLPRDLETICLKCLEKGPERRYQTAEDLEGELRRFLRDEPILARPVSQVEKLWRWCRRKPLVAGLSATTLVLLVSVAIGAPIALYHINQERRKAELANQETRRRAYAAEMSAASRALEENNLGSATELLDQQRPRSREEDLRGLEWCYLWMQTRGDDLAMLRGHRLGVREVAFSPDGELLASASLDQTVRVWDVASGKTLHEFPGPTDQNLHQCVVFSPDGRALAVVSGEKLFLWKASDWQPLRPPLLGAGAPIIFSPDGKILAARSDSELRLWDTTTWESVTLKTGSSQGVRGSLAIAPDNRRLAYGFAGGAPLQIWDLEDRAKAFEFEITAGCLTFLSGGAQLAIGTWNTHQVSLLDIDSWRVVTNYSIGTEDVVFGAVFSRDEKVLAAPVGQEVHLFEVATGRQLAALRGHHREIHSLVHSPVAPLLASAGMDGIIGLWRDQPSRQTHLGEIPSGLEFLSMSSARPQLYSWATNGVLQFWELRKGRLAPTIALSSDAMLTREFGRRTMVTRKFGGRMQISPEGSYAACGTTNGQIHVFECATGKMITTLAVGEGNVRAAAFSPDNRLLLTAQEGDANLRATEGDAHGLLWKWQTKQIDARLPNTFCVPYELPVGTFSPDGRLLAYTSQDYAVNLWDVPAKRLRCTLRGNSWLICAINFSPGGRMLAASGFDRTTCVWDLGAGCASPRKLYGKTEFLWFTRDSRTLITADPEPSVRFWNIATGQRSLTIRDATTVLLAPDDTALLLWRPEGVSLVRIPTLAEIDAMEAGRWAGPLWRQR